MSKRLAPVDLRVATDGSVWHVGNPKAWGKGALEHTDPRESMRLLQADEIRFIGPDYVQGSHLSFDARLVALTDAERRLIERALLALTDGASGEGDQAAGALAKRIRVKD